MAVSFSITSGAAYPEWLWVLQSSLGQPILHGCEVLRLMDQAKRSGVLAQLLQSMVVP